MPTATIRRLGSGVWGKVEPAKLKPSGYGVRLRFLVAYWRVSGIGKVRKDLGAKVRSLRKRAGLSQESLAEKADLHPVYISQVDRGEKAVWTRPAVATRGRCSCG